MSELDYLKRKILCVKDSDFDELALSVFKFQSEKCTVYKNFIKYLGIDIASINSIEKIPFLPISLFKYHEIKSTLSSHELFFLSSGTANDKRSKHIVFDLDFYHINCKLHFEKQFGPLKDWIIIAILPSYIEQSNSSLVSMVDFFITQSENPSSGFYNQNTTEFENIIKNNTNKKVLIIGVTYALLELALLNSLNYSNLYIMETGGMKGRGKELIREELHIKLKQSFKPNEIISEYGMTELSSQAYSLGDEVFHTGHLMKVFCRNIDDPLEILGQDKSGGLNFIDLANIHTCCFIGTDDMGKTINNTSFKVTGRINQSDIRGCNLLSF